MICNERFRYQNTKIYAKQVKCIKIYHQNKTPKKIWLHTFFLAMFCEKSYLEPIIQAKLHNCRPVQKLVCYEFYFERNLSSDKI